MDDVFIQTKGPCERNDFRLVGSISFLTSYYSFMLTLGSFYSKFGLNWKHLSLKLVSMAAAVE